MMFSKSVLNYKINAKNFYLFGNTYGFILYMALKLESRESVIKLKKNKATVLEIMIYV